MSEGFPGLPGSDNMPRGKTLGLSREFRVALAILAVLFVAWHVVPALMVRDNPPISCQFDGGQWSIWNGWSCR